MFLDHGVSELIRLPVFFSEILLTKEAATSEKTSLSFDRRRSLTVKGD